NGDKRPGRAKRRTSGEHGLDVSMLAARLHAARLYSNKTQEQLADEIHRSKGYISALERGKAVPSTVILKLLARHLEVSVGYLLGETKENLQTLKQDMRLLGLFPAPSIRRTEEVIHHLLGEAATILREGNWHDALKLLGESTTAPDDLFRLHLIDW